ncbi:MAG: hypothetical protein GF315_01105 [candidate division Zixibacteria bacterium]|nr:hypothetical protein [candidate division Zixibacteria bacterium]
MRMRFTLTMENLVVNNKHIDNVVLDWEEEVEQDQVITMSQEWITTKNFLTERMTGLQKVGESSLTIEPVEQ